MINKPWFLKVFPVLALIIALSFPVQIYYLYRIPLTDLSKIFSMLTPLNILSMGGLICASLLSSFLSKRVYYVIPILLLVLFTNNAIVGFYGTDFTFAQVCLSFILFSISLKPFYQKEIRAVILNPKLRWWKTPKRYQASQVICIHTKGHKLESETINLSSSGLFVQISSEKPVNVDDIVDIEIKESSPIKLQARVVRADYEYKPKTHALGLEIIQNSEHKKEYLPWFNKNISENGESLAS